MHNMSYFESLEATNLAKCVPLVHHSDDGEAHRRRSFLVCTFGSAVIHGSPWDSRLLLYVTDNAKSCANTYDTLDCWLTWSFTELAEGKWFQHSPWGKELTERKHKAGSRIAGDWRGILVFLRGDEKALAKTLHVTTTWVSEEVCFTCAASRKSESPNLYTAFGKNAKHRDSIVDFEEFVTRKCNANPWVRIPGFHPSCIMYDWLHVLDLSLIPDAAASVVRLHNVDLF